MEGLLKILTLEDRSADYQLCKRHLLKHYPDAMFTWAANEQEFLEKIGWANYDLIISDYHLPGYNGLEALLYVKENHPGLPFIFLTGDLSNEEESANAILSGANGYVLKENLKTLHEHVAKVMAEAADQRADLAKVKAAETEHRFRLQKAIGLLEQASDFSTRNQIIDLLRSDLAAKTPDDDDRRFTAE